MGWYLEKEIFDFARACSRKYGHACNFSEKRQKKKDKKGKLFENLGKNVQNLKIF